MSSGRDSTLVSIGVPVYNEERYIDAALQSLRQQDHANLEIVISDNASTDGTVAICERHAAQDARIRIERAPHNRGATANFLRALELARGEFFMWAGGHDLISSNMMSECVHLLVEHPDACLAFGGTRWIDAHGKILARQSGFTDTRGLAPAARLFTVLWGNMHPVMGLIRTRTLRTCRPLPNIVGGDLVLLSELALRGHFLHAAGTTWSRRELRAEMQHGDKVRRYASSQFGFSRSRIARAFPLLRLPLALSGVVLRSERPALEKAAILAALIPSFGVRYLVGRQTRYG